MWSIARLLRIGWSIVKKSHDKGCISRELIKFECRFELIHELLKSLLGAFDNLKEADSPLLILNLEGISLCELPGQIRKKCDAAR